MGRRLVLWIGLGIFVLVLLRHAWVCDDAFITLRTVKNFVAGDGLRWNVVERVQGYTHPLWMFLVSAFYFVTREPFWTTMFVGGALSCAVVWLVAMRMATSRFGGLYALAAFVSSKAFMDYTTSGLENPLVHVLLCVFLWIDLCRPRDGRTLLRLSLVAALVATTRLDAMLLVLPPLAFAFWRERGWRAVRTVAAGMLPLIAWELFALVYYGFPFPNTAYAKLGTGVAAADLMAQGLFYYLAEINGDPVTLLVIGLGLACAARRREAWPAALGIVLYLLYIVRIGGDFMLGRYFTAPLLAAVVLAVRSGIDARLPALLVLVFGFVGTRGPTLTGDAAYNAHALSRYHVTDERGFYFGGNSLLGARRLSMPLHAWRDEGEGYPAGDVIVKGGGMHGYYAPRTTYLVDEAALTEPLLARIPALADDDWTVGHLRRVVPDGYVATLRSGRNQLRDPNLARYYDRLALVTRGPLWSLDRLKAIWQLNTGTLDDLIDAETYRLAIVRRTPAEMARRLAPGSAWNGSGAVPLHPRGCLEISLPLTHAARATLVADTNDRYVIHFFRGAEELGAAIAPLGAGPGMQPRVVAVPAAALAGGWDRVRISGQAGDHVYSVGAFTPD